MKFKLWVEIMLIIFASASGLLIFADSLLISFLGLAGAMIIAIPLAKYGRLQDIEKR